MEQRSVESLLVEIQTTKQSMPSGDSPVRVVIVGHVDHGKSTFVGRLLWETGSLPTGKQEQIQTACQRRGVKFEWAFLMDAFQSERDQNITIDVAQTWLHTATREYVIIDAPGHREFLKNMVTGAASADAALLLIAANEGVREQTRQHGYLLSLLGVRQLVVLVNKMDLVGYDRAVFSHIESECSAFLKKAGIEPQVFIPIVAADGVNLAGPSGETPWYQGPSVVAAMDGFECLKAPSALPLRIPIQDVYRFDHRRILVGRVESGQVSVGDKLVFWPGGKEASVETIEAWSAPKKSGARTGETVGLTLKEQIFVERGQVATPEGMPPDVTHKFKARLFWLGKEPLVRNRSYKLKVTTQEVSCQVLSVDRVIDADSLGEVAGVRDSVGHNEVAEVTIHTRTPIAIDPYSENAATGRLVLADGTMLAGGGIAYKVLDAPSLKAGKGPAAERLTLQQRHHRFGHKSVVVWLAGEPAEISRIAQRLECILFARGMAVFLLDESNLTGVLTSMAPDLETLPPSRTSWNVAAAISETVLLLAQAGLVTLVAWPLPESVAASMRALAEQKNVGFLSVLLSSPGDTPAGDRVDSPEVAADQGSPSAYDLRLDIGEQAADAAALTEIVDKLTLGFQLPPPADYVI
ncbi:MAG: GTP-binding protein [Acidobacteria bacterium]|nr:GTP-binding protein [Acidobacteriota bacterium]